VTQYLIRYRRSTGELLHFEDLGLDRAAAMDRRSEEERAHKDDLDIEVVLLSASSREALLRTHARYFKSVPELAAALASALPAIRGTADRPLSKQKDGTDQQRGSDQREP
jgi:hypothetical protein